MDLKSLEKLVGKAIRDKTFKISKIRRLLAGGQFPQANGTELKHMTWEQTIEEKYRRGFRLWQKVRLNRKDDIYNGQIFYIAGFNPYPDYTYVLLCKNPDNYNALFGFKHTDLVAVED